jgi:hypothetical protein
MSDERLGRVRNYKILRNTKRYITTKSDIVTCFRAYGRQACCMLHEIYDST